MVDRFPGKAVLLQAHGHLSMAHGHQAVLLQALYGTVQRLYRNPAFFVKILPGFFYRDLLFSSIPWAAAYFST